MQARLTDKVVFPLVVLFIKTFRPVGARTESGRDGRFYKNLFLNRGSCCWKFYYVESHPVSFSMRMLKIKSKIKPRLNKVVRPFFFY